MITKVKSKKIHKHSFKGKYIKTGGGKWRSLKTTFGLAPKHTFGKLNRIDSAVNSKIAKKRLANQGFVDLAHYTREERGLAKKSAGQALLTYKTQTIEQQQKNFNSLAKTLHLKYGRNNKKKSMDIKAFTFKLYHLLHPPTDPGAYK